MKLLCFLCFFIALPLAQAVLQINEIMYNPSPAQCARDVCEWVELWNNGPDAINLSGCYFEGKELEGALPGEAYLIVARNAEEFSAVFGEVEYLQERSFTLRNGENTVILNGTCSDSAHYDPEMGGEDNNKTLEKNAAGIWDESFPDGGTPGRENSIYRHSRDFTDLYINEVFPDPFGDDAAQKDGGEWIELYNAGELVLDVEGLEFRDAAGNKLFISRDKIIDDSVLLDSDEYVVVYRDGDRDFTLNNDGYEEVWLCHEDEDCRSGEDYIDMVSYSGSATGRSWSFFEVGWFQTAPTPDERNYHNLSCDWGLGMEMPRAILTPEEFNFNLTLTRFQGFEENITVTGRIETIDGELVQEYRPWSNERIINDQKKRYSPNLREGLYQVSFALGPLTCPESDPSDNTLDRLVAINPDYRRSASSLTVKEIDFVGRRGKAEWGEHIMVELQAYKGNTTKKVIEAWVEFNGKTASGRSTLRLEDRYQAYSLSIPVQLHCSNKEGTAKLIVEGLDLREEEPFAVEGADEEECRKILALEETGGTDAAAPGKKKGAIVLSLSEAPAAAAPGEAFRLQVTGEGDGSRYKVWSYVYRGNKCYSCSGKERDANAQEPILQEEPTMIDFLLQLDKDVKEGEYKLKVKWLKEGQKTEKELTVPIIVQLLDEQGSTLEQTTGLFAAAGKGVPSGADTNMPNFASSLPYALREKDGGFIAYQSNTEKAKTLIPLFMAIAFALVSVIAFWKKK